MTTATLTRRAPLAPVEVCACTPDHRPATGRMHDHHLWPKFLGGPTIRATLLHLCPTTHDLTHEALRRMLRDGWAPWAAGTGVTRYAHHIATLGWQAWDAAGRPPYPGQPPTA